MVLRAQWPLGTIAQFFRFVAEEKKKKKRRRQKNKGILWLGYHRYPSKQETYPWTSAVSQTLRALKSAKGNAITKWDLDKEQLMLTLRQNLYEYIPRRICF